MTATWIDIVVNFAEIKRFVVPESRSMNSCGLLRVTAWQGIVDIYLDGVAFAIPERWSAKGFDSPILKLSFCDCTSFEMRCSPVHLPKIRAILTTPTHFVVSPVASTSGGGVGSLIEVEFSTLLARVMADPAELTRDMEPSGFAKNFD